VATGWEGELSDTPDDGGPIKPFLVPAWLNDHNETIRMQYERLMIFKSGKSSDEIAKERRAKFRIVK